MQGISPANWSRFRSRCQSVPRGRAGPHRDRLAACWPAALGQALAEHSAGGRSRSKPTRSSRASAIATCGRNCTRSRLRSAPTGSRGTARRRWRCSSRSEPRSAPRGVGVGADLQGRVGRDRGLPGGERPDRARRPEQRLQSATVIPRSERKILRRVLGGDTDRGDAEKRGRDEPDVLDAMVCCSPATTSCAGCAGAGGSVDRGSAVPQDARRAAFRDPVAHPPSCLKQQRRQNPLTNSLEHREQQ